MARSPVSAERRVWLLRALTFLQAVLVVLGRVVATSQLLQTAGSRALPWVYVGQAISIGLLTLILFGVVDRVGRASLLAVMFGLFAAGTAAAALAPERAATVVAPALLLFVETGIALSSIHFWLLASELLSPDQARRHFPSFTLAGGLGATVGGAAGHLAPLFGTRGMIVLLVLPALACAALALVIRRRYAYRVGPQADASRVGFVAEFRGGLAIVRSSRLLRWVGLLTALITGLGLGIDYLFNRAAAAGWSAERLPAVLGNVNIAVSVAQLLLVGLLGSRLFTTFGLIHTFASYPAGAFVAALGGLPAGPAWSAVFLKVLDRLENYLILNPGLGIALNAFPREQRGRAGFIYGGLVKPMAMAGAGAGLLLLRGHPLALWAILAAAFAVFFLVLRRLARVYRDTLVDNLRHTDRRLLASSIEALAERENRTVVPRLLEFLERADDPVLAENVLRAAGTIGDPRFVPALMRALSGDNTSLKIAAAGSLRQFPSDAVREALLLTLRTEPSARVKASIMAALGRAGMTLLHPALRAGLADPAPRVRANAIESIGLSGDPALIAELRPLLESESPRAVANVVVALARVDAERPAALAALGRILDGGDRSLLASALWAVGEVADEARLPLCRRLSGDADAMVRRNALIALGKLDQVEVVEPLVALLLAAEDDGQAVARAFDRLGSKVREALLERLSGLSREARRPALRSFTGCGLNYPEELERLRAPTRTSPALRSPG